FFSGGGRHTRSDRDWSSDVCSSDLAADGLRRVAAQLFDRAVEELEPLRLIRPDEGPQELDPIGVGGVDRVAIEADPRTDDERPRDRKSVVVGKEGRSRRVAAQ